MVFLKFYFLEHRPLWITLFCFFSSILLSFVSQNPGPIIGLILVYLIDSYSEYAWFKRNRKTRI